MKLIASSLWIELICVKCTRTRSAEQAKASSATAAKQAADQRAGTSGDSYIDQVAMPAVKARALICIAASCIIRTGISSSVVNTSVSPMTWATVSFSRHWQADSEDKKHHYRDQNFLHSS